MKLSSIFTSEGLAEVSEFLGVFNLLYCAGEQGSGEAVPEGYSFLPRFDIPVGKYLL